MGPSRAALLVVIIAIGLTASMASLTQVIEVTFGDDPIMRLVTLDQSPPVEPGPARCAMLVENADSTLAPLSLTGLVRDRACRQATTRRRATAMAAAVLVLVLGMVTVATAAKPRVRWPVAPGRAADLDN
ncbi:MAG: hypothetical protein ACRDRT_10990 [Pseudonocardiaceae bacterium]